MDPVAEQLHEEREERLQLRARSRHSYVALGTCAVVLAASLALALSQPTSVDLDAAAAVIAAYVALWHVEFEVGPVSVSPVQAAAVAMWFVVDPSGLPLAIVAAQLLAYLVRSLQHRTSIARTARGLAFSVADAAFILGPALVLLALAPAEPTLSSAWIYLLALAAQFAVDGLVTTARTKLAGTSLVPLSDWRWLWSIDAALAPLGIAIAVATSTNDLAPLALLPLAAILGQFARERDERIQHALELSSAYRGTARLMGDVLEADDAYTGGEHTQGVVGLALALGEAVGLDPRQMRDLEFGALLHDIGKLRVPNEIINKPGKLNDEEWAIIKRHPGYGQEMLDRVGGELSQAGIIVRAHHERWDGGGYPDGLVAEEIPIQARIITICDSYSAMTTDRSYRKGMSAEDALDELERCSGSQFDPNLVTHARRLLLGSEQALHGAALLRVVPEPPAATAAPQAA